MKIIFLAIGDELLNGRTLEKNLHFFGHFLLKTGFELHHAHIHRDEALSLKESIANYFNEADVLILSGGLGPTLDDITKNILADCFSLELQESEQAAQIALENYQRRNLTWHKDLNSYHVIPKDFIPLSNPKGLAPALLYLQKQNKKILMAGPGVPSEFRAIMETHFLNSLQLLFAKKTTIKNSFCIRTKAIPEEKIFNQLCPKLWSELSQFGKVQSLPGRFGVDIIVNKEIEKNDVESFNLKIKNHIESSDLKKYVWEFGGKGLEQVIIEKLDSLNLQLALAESCTGGLVTSLLTDVPGSSKVLRGSVICYQDQIKLNELDIPAKLLESAGAVSQEVTDLLAKNISKKFKTPIGIAITGEAGPTASSTRHPIGTVYISLYLNDKIQSHHFNYKGDRTFLKNRFAQTVLSILFDSLKEIE